MHEPMKMLGFWTHQKGSGDTELPFYNIKRARAPQNGTPTQGRVV